MIEVEVDDDAWTRALETAASVAEDAARAALQDAGVVTVSLTDDDTVADLNQRFRDKPGPTNVLSFPAPDTAKPFLGDVILAYGVCTREAADQGKTLADHLAHLTVHGVLHLRGHDHMDDAEAEAMEALEREILATLGVADPYRGDR